jgi:hypothetical protein
MATKLRLGICSALFVAAIGGACSTESVDDSRDCFPTTDRRECTCENGDEGFEFCNDDGDGYGECDCTPRGSTGGSGGDIGATGGSSGRGTGGTTGGGGGADTDAGPDSSVDDGGTSADSSVPVDGSTIDDGGGPDASLHPCDACMQDQCLDELLECADAAPCLTRADGGISEVDCMDLCLILDVGADGGALDQAAVDFCAASCGESGAVDAATKSLYECMFDATDGSDCIDQCLLSD